MAQAKIFPTTIRLVVDLYNGGKSIRELAVKFDYSYSGMHDLLLRNGVKFRKKGPVKGRAKKGQFTTATAKAAVSKRDAAQAKRIGPAATKIMEEALD